MSVTNAISGMVGIGGCKSAERAIQQLALLLLTIFSLCIVFIMGGGYIPQTFPQTLGALSVLLAFVNVSGGFVITKRMLGEYADRTDLTRRCSW